MLNSALNRHRVTRKAKLCTVAATLIFLLPLAALRSPAQALGSNITGSVFDSGGSFLPSATVIMVNTKMHTRTMTATDANGIFRIEALPSGEYEMHVMKIGFQPSQVAQVILDSTRDAIQNVKLEARSFGEPNKLQGTPKTKEASLVGVVQPLQKFAPVYPARAKAARVQGAVLLDAIIGTNGIPVSLQVVDSQIDPDLARSAVEAVSQWRYRPTLLNGQPIEVRTNVTVNYTLAP